MPKKKKILGLNLKWDVWFKSVCMVCYSMWVLFENRLCAEWSDFVGCACRFDVNCNWKHVKSVWSEDDITISDRNYSGIIFMRWCGSTIALPLYACINIYIYHSFRQNENK